MTGVQTCALRSEEHTSELQSHDNIVCRLLLEKKKTKAKVVTKSLCREWIANRLGSAARAQEVLAPPRHRVRLSPLARQIFFIFFFFNDTATTEIYTLSLHDALPI